MLIARPANSRGKPGTRNAVRIMTRPDRRRRPVGGVRRLGPGRPVDPVRPARHQPADHRDQARAGGPPLRGGRAVGVAQHHLAQLLLQVPGLLRGQPHLRPADAGGLAPLRGLALAGGPGRAQPLQLALDDHVGQRLGGQLAGLVLVVADVVAPLEALADRLPGPVAAGAAAGLAHEAVLGQPAQVPRAVRGRLVDQHRDLARGERALGHEGAEDRHPHGVRERLEGVGLGDPAASERHGMKVSFRKTSFNPFPALTRASCRVDPGEVRGRAGPRVRPERTWLGSRAPAAQTGRHDHHSPAGRTRPRPARAGWHLLAGGRPRPTGRRARAPGDLPGARRVRRAAGGVSPGSAPTATEPTAYDEVCAAGPGTRCWTSAGSRTRSDRRWPRSPGARHWVYVSSGSVYRRRRRARHRRGRTAARAAPGAGAGRHRGVRPREGRLRAGLPRTRWAPTGCSSPAPA